MLFTFLCHYLRNVLQKQTSSAGLSTDSSLHTQHFTFLRGITLKRLASNVRDWKVCEIDWDGLCMKLVEEITEEQRHISQAPCLMYSVAQFWFSQMEGKIKSVQKEGQSENRKECKYRHRLHKTTQSSIALPTLCILG